MIWRLSLAMMLAGPVVWHREAVTLEFPSPVWIRINDGAWLRSSKARIAEEGVNKVAIRKTEEGRDVDQREVRIDITPPVITLITEPLIDQQGGLYFATPETVFTLKATDALSGVSTLEFAIDGKYAPYSRPVQLPPGTHELRGRAVDGAGNRSEVMTGEGLGAGGDAVVQIEIK